MLKERLHAITQGEYPGIELDLSNRELRANRSTWETRLPRGNEQLPFWITNNSFARSQDLFNPRRKWAI
ncbi:MAG: hypothetical protein ABGX22_09975 [Pirellulaceae bacterium]|nr:hypothetical protein [Planctomycetaceae bacterium]